MVSCDKLETDDDNEKLFGESVLTGRTFFTNELTGSGVKTVKKGVTLKLAYSETNTGTDYDAMVTSNDDGYFVFTNISNNGALRIFGEFEEDGISFKLNTTFTNRPTTLDLNFVYDPDYYNGIRIRSSDASGSPVPEMNYYVYNNQTAFTANDTSNAILKKQLNQYGIALLNDLQQGTYYVVLQGMINNINYSGTGSIQFNGTDVADLNIQVTALVQPGLTLIVQDPNGFVVSGLKFAFLQVELYLAELKVVMEVLIPGYLITTVKLNSPEFHQCSILFYVRILFPASLCMRRIPLL